MYFLLGVEKSTIIFAFVILSLKIWDAELPHFYKKTLQSVF